MQQQICCFSGYRPEKMPANMQEHSPAFQEMQVRLRKAIIDAVQNGYRYFLSGMSRGFDLWAAEVVLSLQKEGLPIELWAAIAFPDMQEYWEPQWQERYETVLQQASQTFSVMNDYTPNCYTMRDRFLAEQSSMCICFFDGKPGGTQYTVNYARKRGLTIINLAEAQLSFFQTPSLGVDTI